MNRAVWSVCIWPVIGLQAACKKCEHRAGGSVKPGLVSSGDSVGRGVVVIGDSGEVSVVGFIERMFTRNWLR